VVRSFVLRTAVTLTLTLRAVHSATGHAWGAVVRSGRECRSEPGVVVGGEEMEALARRLQRLEDREEIRSLIARYGRAVDDRDWEALALQFTADASFESVGEPVVGTEAIVAYYQERTAPYVASYHYPHTIEIALIDDHRAEGLVCAHAELTINGDTVMVALRYYDDYRRIDGRWLFRSRKTQFLYVLKLSDLPTEMASRLRVRWPGAEPVEAHIGADVVAATLAEPRASTTARRRRMRKT